MRVTYKLDKYRLTKEEKEERLLSNDDEVFINEITKRCCNAPYGTIHAEVQYTALHFQSVGKAKLLPLLEEVKREGFPKCVKNCPVLNKLLADYPEVKLDLYLATLQQGKEGE